MHCETPVSGQSHQQIVSFDGVNHPIPVATASDIARRQPGLSATWIARSSIGDSLEVHKMPLSAAEEGREYQSVTGLHLEGCRSKDGDIANKEQAPLRPPGAEEVVRALLGSRRLFEQEGSWSQI